MAEQKVQNNIVEENVFEVNFKVKVLVDRNEIEKEKKMSRGIINGFFEKDINISQVLAINKAREAILKQSAIVETDIKQTTRSDLNFNI